MMETAFGKQLTEQMRQWFEDLREHAKQHPTEAHALLVAVRSHCSSIPLSITEAEEAQTGEFTKP